MISGTYMSDDYTRNLIVIQRNKNRKTRVWWEKKGSECNENKYRWEERIARPLITTKVYNIEKTKLQENKRRRYCLFSFFLLTYISITVYALSGVLLPENILTQCVSYPFFPLYKTRVYLTTEIYRK
jgi:hypothetical protein